jgi:hypothetical protein
MAESNHSKDFIQYALIVGFEAVAAGAPLWTSEV